MSLAERIKKTFLKSLYIFLFISVSFNTAAFCEESSHKSNIVKIGYYENEVFQEGAAKDLPKSGYSYEYYRKLAEYTGWQYEYVYGDFSTLYKKFLKGEIDLIAGLAYTEDRSRLFYYPEFAMGNTPYLLMKKTFNKDITSDLSTINNRSIGVLDSIQVDFTKDWIKKNNLNMDLKVYYDQPELLDAFGKNLVDLVLIEGAAIDSHYESEFVMRLGEADYYLCVTKNRPDLLADLNEALNHLYLDSPDFLNQIYSKYYSHGVANSILTSVESNWIQSHGTICIGYLNNFIPYSNKDKKGDVCGLVKELVPELLRNLKLENKVSVTYKSFDNSTEMISALNANVIDAAFPIGGGLSYLEQKGIYKSDSVFESNVSLVYGKKSNPENADCFAVNRNNIIQENYVKTYFPKAKILYYNSIEECLEIVKRQKDVCTTLNGLRVNAILKNTRFSSLKTRNLKDSDDCGFGVKIGNEGFLRLLNRGIRTISNQYVLDNSYKYMDGLYHFSFKDFIRNNVAFIFLAILTIALITLNFELKANKKNHLYLEEQKKKNDELNKAQKDLQIQLEMVKDLNLEIKHSKDDTSRTIMEMLRYAASEKNADEVLNKLITYLGKKMEADRVYIFEMNKNGSYDNTYEWCNKGVISEKYMLQNVPADVMEVWMEEFKKSSTVVVNNLEAYREVSEPIYEILKPQNINTLVAAPIINYGEISGFFGIDNPPKEKLEYLSDLFTMVEFVFSMMIRIRDNTNEIEETARHDELTGCLNRKALTWAYDGNYDAEDSCGIVSVDMNGLKKINDSQGHNAGDKFICRMAETLKDVFGAENVYRMGGDEFIVVQLETTKEEFYKLLTDCRMLVGNTASIGGVFDENLKKGFNELLRQSDQDMYKQKELFYQEKRK